MMITYNQPLNKRWDRFEKINPKENSQ